MSIANCLYNLKSEKEGRYELVLQFQDQTAQVLSTKKFLFFQEAKERSDQELIDVYTKNGLCSDDPLTKLFIGEDATGVKKAVQLIKRAKLQGATIFVLDLKDPKNRLQRK